MFQIHTSFQFAAHAAHRASPKLIGLNLLCGFTVGC
jgi:hypothetical protein